MVKIRLVKLGSKASKFYRIVAIDKKRKNSGKALDTIGYWNPVKLTKTIDMAKLKSWQEKGAIMSSAVEKIINTK